MPENAWIEARNHVGRFGGSLKSSQFLRSFTSQKLFVFFTSQQQKPLASKNAGDYHFTNTSTRSVEEFLTFTNPFLAQSTQLVI
jgi:hypothetical protein